MWVLWPFAEWLMASQNHRHRYHEEVLRGYPCHQRSRLPHPSLSRYRHQWCRLGAHRPHRSLPDVVHCNIRVNRQWRKINVRNYSISCSSRRHSSERIIGERSSKIRCHVVEWDTNYGQCMNQTQDPSKLWSWSDSNLMASSTPLKDHDQDVSTLTNETDLLYWSSPSALIACLFNRKPWVFSKSSTCTMYRKRLGRAGSDGIPNLKTYVVSLFTHY